MFETAVVLIIIGLILLLTGLLLTVGKILLYIGIFIFIAMFIRGLFDHFNR